jgi:uncharacterized caspase-like protein
MKKYIAVIVFSILSISAFTQGIIEGKSSPMTVNITKDLSKLSGNANVITGQSDPGLVSIIKDKDITTKPPRLQADAPQFIDTDGNNLINANESFSIFFTISNMGEGPALNLTATVSEKNRVPGLIFQSKPLGTLPPGTTKTFDIQANSSLNTTNSTASLVVSVGEANGNGIVLSPLAVQVKAYEAPLVKIANVKWDAIMKGMPFNVTVDVQNTGPGAAENVTLLLPVTDDIIFIEGSKSVEVGNLAPGEIKPVIYTLITKPTYSLSQIFLPFKLSERFGKYVDNSKSSKTILIEQQLASNKNVTTQGVQGNVAVQQPQAQATTSTYISDVDRDIPINPTKNPNRVALIFGNENYSQAINADANVPYARNDAIMFAEYAKKVLCVEDKFVFLVTDASCSRMKQQIQRTLDIIKYMGPSAELIFYYAGHGFPEQSTKIPYIIPVDVSSYKVSDAIKLADVYSQLSNSGANKVTVFLDACFSGGGRDLGPVTARSVRMAPETEGNMVSGNMIVFSAATGEQFAQAKEKEKHGLFTYYLLKRLKETSGNVTYGDLFEYIKNKVGLDALTENVNAQDPVYISSDLLGDKWKTWKVK